MEFDTNYAPYQSGPGFPIAPRNIALAIVLSIVTCGIYELYWIVKLNDEINQLANDTAAASGGMVVVLSIITCGIYGLYWMYKMGVKCDQIKGREGNTGILYLILGILGVGIISECLMQDTINKMVQ